MRVGHVMRGSKNAEQTWTLSVPTAVWQTMPGGSGAEGAGGGANGVDTFSCNPISNPNIELFIALIGLCKHW